MTFAPNQDTMLVALFFERYSGPLSTIEPLSVDVLVRLSRPIPVTLVNRFNHAVAHHSILKRRHTRIVLAHEGLVRASDIVAEILRLSDLYRLHFGPLLARHQFDGR